MRKNDRLIITDLDSRRIEKLLASVDDNDFPGRSELESDLCHATIINSRQVPDNVVTMNSKVKFRIEPSNTEFCLKLVYPNYAGSDTGTVSILAPVGSAMLGLSVGNRITWPRPGGGMLRIRVTDLLYQPERAGAYHE